MTAPQVTVELDIGGVWTDVSGYVSMAAGEGLTVTRGRSQQFDTVQPGTVQATFDNSDGRFTSGKPTLVNGSANPLYPYVRVNTPIRVTESVSGGLYPSPGLFPAPGLYPSAGLFPSGAAVASKFTGFVDRWPATWEGGMLGKVVVEATDRFKLLARRKFKAAWLEAILANAPTMLYPLTEADGDTFADFLAVGPMLPVRLSTSPIGSVVLGQPGPFTSGETALTLSPAPGFGGLSGAALPFDRPQVTSLPFTVGFWVKTDVIAGPLFHQSYLAHPLGEGDLHVRGGDFDVVSFGPGSAGSVKVYVNAGTYTAPVESWAESSGPVDDNEWHRLHGGVRADGSPFVLVDGVDVTVVGASASGGLALSGNATALFGDRDRGVYFNGSVSAPTFYGHAVTEAEAAQEYLAGATGFAGERSDQRLARLASWAGVTDVRLDVGSSVVGAQNDLDGSTQLAAMQEVEHTEQGVLFMAGDGFLVFHSRYHSLGMTPVFTVTAPDIGPDFEVGVDEDWLVNDVDVSGVGVGPVRRFDQASIDDHGPVTDAQDTLLTTVADLEGFAGYWLSRRAQPLPRSPGLDLDPMTEPALAGAAVGVDVGQLVALSSLPVEAGPVGTQVIESITETVDVSTWHLSVSTTTADLNKYGVWDLSDWDDGSVWAA